MTAYTYPSAVHVDAAGIDILLVGDSLAMVELGHNTTLPVTVDQMIYHCQAVARGAKTPLLVADMPFGSYEGSRQQAYGNAIRFLKEAGMDAVKVGAYRVCDALFISCSLSHRLRAVALCSTRFAGSCRFVYRIFCAAGLSGCCLLLRTGRCGSDGAHWPHAAAHFRYWRLPRSGARPICTSVAPKLIACGLIRPCCACATQGRTLRAAKELIEDARALQDAGSHSILPCLLRYNCLFSCPVDCCRMLLACD